MHCPLPLRQIEVPWELSTRRRFVANSRILQRYDAELFVDGGFAQV